MRYMIVADQTASSPELLDAVRQRMGAESEYVLLVPASPVNHFLTWEEGESRMSARHSAEDALQRMTAMGARVSRAEIGDPSPIQAIADEIREHGDYDELIISTLPVGRSRWLGLDLPHRAQHRFGIPVHHVVSAQVAIAA